MAQQKEALLNALAEEERRNEHPPLKRASAWHASYRHYEVEVSETWRYTHNPQVAASFFRILFAVDDLSGF